MRLSIKIVNADVVRQGLEDLHDEIPKIGRLQIYRTVQAVIRRMKVYPPPPAGSRYVRTYRLRNAWKIEPKENGYAVSADPVSPKGRPYGRYVVGFARGDGQAWMHKGRWNLLRDVMEDEVKKLPNEIEKNISMVARAKGLA